MKNEKVSLRFLIGVYLLLLGFIIIITTVVFAMYGNIATTTRTGINAEAQKAAIDNLGTLAQSFADLIKVTVGAVIGALSATLQSLMASKSKESKVRSPATPDEPQNNVKPIDDKNM